MSVDDDRAVKRVPVKISGHVVGTAEVGPDGQISMEINPTPQGEELKRILHYGLASSFSIRANYDSVKDRRSPLGIREEG